MLRSLFCIIVIEALLLEFKTGCLCEFCYLGGVIWQAGGYTDTVTACILSSWMAFHDFLPTLTNKGISLLNCGEVFTAPVRNVLLLGSETWLKSTGDL